MQSTTTFRIHPLTADQASHHRLAGGEIYIADSKPGYPCRRCLRDAEISEELILVSHDPFERDSPYRSASPIFLHREECGNVVTETNVSGTHALPEQLTCRQLSVRAFDANAMMVDAAVIDGSVLATTIERLFGNDDARQLHIHNAGRGCWATTISRCP